MALTCVTEQPGLMRSPAAGGPGGGDWDDRLSLLAIWGPQNAATARPSAIELFGDYQHLHCLRTTYDTLAPIASITQGHGAGYANGQPAPQCRQIRAELGATEVIVQAGVTRRAYQPEQWLQSMGFVIHDVATGQLRHVGSGGQQQQHPAGLSLTHQYEYWFVAAPGFCISHLHGRNGWYIDALGVYFSAAVPRTWSPQQHHLYPPDFKVAVRALLLCGTRNTQLRGLLSVVDAAHEVIQALNSACYHTFTRVEDAGFTTPAVGAAAPVGFSMRTPGDDLPPAGRAQPRRPPRVL